MNIKETIQFIFNSFKFWFIVDPWEEAIRVRFGKHQKLWTPGIYFRIPHFDKIFVQETRLRIVSMPLQSVTLYDKTTLTIKCAIGYKVNDILKLYDTIHQPETTIINIALDKVCVYLNNAISVSEEQIKSTVLEELRETDFGIEFEYLKITSMCEVRTYRLIQDQHWEYEGMDLGESI